jgi:hypothetical protein
MVLRGFASVAELRGWQQILHQKSPAFLGEYIIMNAGAAQATAARGKRQRACREQRFPAGCRLRERRDV